MKTTIAVVTGVLLISTAALAQRPPGIPPAPRGPLTNPPTKPDPIERLGEGLFRVGTIRVDTTKRELAVTGTINDVKVLEFVANTKGGWKAYESAIELDTNAITFNVALLLIGMDPARSVPATKHFDPTPPKGDPVEVSVEWIEDGKSRRVPAEELVYNYQTKRTLPAGPWVYTGSVFNSRTNAYLADVEGSLIGFVHTPAPIIENPGAVPGQFGDIGLNPALGLKPGQPVTVIVRAQR